MAIPFRKPVGQDLRKAALPQNHRETDGSGKQMWPRCHHSRSGDDATVGSPCIGLAYLLESAVNEVTKELQYIVRHTRRLRNYGFDNSS